MAVVVATKRIVAWRLLLQDVQLHGDCYYYKAYTCICMEVVASETHSCMAVVTEKCIAS